MNPGGHLSSSSHNRRREVPCLHSANLKVARDPKGALTGFAARNRRAVRAFGLQNTLHVLPSQREDRLAHDRPVGCCEVRLHQPRRAVRRACQDEVVHIESGSMPAFASSDARVYWAAADSHERSNGRLFRSLTAALPNSLDLAGRLELARSFAAHVTAGQMPYTLAVHAGLSKEPGAAKQPAPAPCVLRTGERRGGAGGGTVVPAGGAGGPGPGVRGREEERAHEAAGVAGGDARNVGGGNEPGVRPRGRGGPGDGREPRRATGACARGRRRGGGRAPSAQPAVRAHRAGGEAPLGGEVARAEAGPVRRVRAGVGCCPGGPAGARAGRGGSRRGEAEDRRRST